MDSQRRLGPNAQNHEVFEEGGIATAKNNLKDVEERQDGALLSSLGIEWQISQTGMNGSIEHPRDLDQTLKIMRSLSRERMKLVRMPRMIWRMSTKDKMGLSCQVWGLRIQWQMSQIGKNLPFKKVK
jgi:hypothetical protein